MTRFVQPSLIALIQLVTPLGDYILGRKGALLAPLPALRSRQPRCFSGPNEDWLGSSCPREYVRFGTVDRASRTQAKDDNASVCSILVESLTQLIGLALIDLERADIAVETGGGSRNLPFGYEQVQSSPTRGVVKYSGVALAIEPPESLVTASTRSGVREDGSEVVVLGEPPIAVSVLFAGFDIREENNGLLGI
ncbi:hypothetical protein [Streptomyces sp. NPDC003032]